MFEQRTGHPYWIWKSVMKSAKILGECLETATQEQVELVSERIAEMRPENVFFVGTGSSGYAGVANAYLFEEITSLPSTWHLTAELGAYPPSTLGASSLFVISSHSGRTPGDLHVIEMAKQRGAFTVGVTDIADSPLAKAVDAVVPGPGGPKAEMPATRTYAAGMFRVAQLAIALGKRMGRSDVAEEYEGALRRIPTAMQSILDELTPRVADLVEILGDCKGYFVAGAGPNLSNVYEGELAMLQSTCVGVQGMHVEEVLHGPIQAFTDEMCLIAVAAPGPLQERILQVARAVEILGGRVVTFAPAGTQGIVDTDLFISMPDGFPELLTPILYIVPFWLLGYQFSLRNGLDADRLSMDSEVFQRAIASLAPQGSKFDSVLKKD